MRDNETISRARGENKWDECSVVKESICMPWRSDVDPCDECTRSPHKPYDSDPTAWDSDLYAWIEGQGTDLVQSFTSHLKLLTIGTGIASLTARHAMRLIKATPPQKARALAQAIKERA